MCVVPLYTVYVSLYTTKGSAPGGTCHNVTALSLHGAKLEKTSLSADVPQTNAGFLL